MTKAEELRKVDSQMDRLKRTVAAGQLELKKLRLHKAEIKKGK